jgi:uncharacterized protein YwgA
MDNEYVVSALGRKRAALAGLVPEAALHLARLREAIASIDIALHVFDPAADLVKGDVMSTDGSLHESDNRFAGRTLFRFFVKNSVIGSLGKIRFRRHGGAGTGRARKMTRQEVLLAMLAASEGRPYTPVQIQKALFLADDRISDAFDRHSRYDFQPYDYGPFDSQVYSDVEGLEREGLAQIDQQPGSRWRTYATTEGGLVRGRGLLAEMNTEQLEVLRKISDLVRSLSFNDLVSAIYRAYPHMRERSVFRD